MPTVVPRGLHNNYQHDEHEQLDVFEYDDDDAGELRAFLSRCVHSAATTDLDCSQIPYRNLRVIYTVPQPGPHNFDGDRDGIGCER
jgi:type IV secretory pathway VirJ component